MRDFITLLNCASTNWLDKKWAKNERKRRMVKELLLIEKYFPNKSNKQKAQIMGISYCYYCILKRRYLK